MDREEQLLIAQVEDKISQCQSWSSVTATSFLDMHEQSVVRSHFGKSKLGCRLKFYGGYADAERAVCFCLPDYVGEDDEEEYYADSISVVRVSHSKRASAGSSGRALRHGDYLGSVLGLGIKRETVGDILVRDDGADIIVLKEIVPFLLSEYSSVGRSIVSTEEAALSDLIVPEREYEVFSDTVASLRLDNVISSAFRVSRSGAQDAIRQGLVFVNGIESYKADAGVNEGDVLVLRHKGRVILDEVGGTSRKGRTYLKFRVSK